MTEGKAKTVKRCGQRWVKLKSYATLKRKLDRVFSEWTRRSYADHQGFIRCVCCREAVQWKRAQAAHFVSRVHLSTRYDPENVYPCCYACNVLRRGNYAEFALALGERKVAELVRRKRKPVKYRRGDLQAMIEEYQAKLAVLETMEKPQ